MYLICHCRCSIAFHLDIKIGIAFLVYVISHQRKMEKVQVQDNC